jgi:predicted RNase H-like nuclease (RuvC/YqgF family)
MDDEALIQRKEYDQIINERDVLGTQLIRRNDELALLYEKMKIESSFLRRGEEQYAQRLQDIRMLKIKVKDLERELRLSRQKGSNARDLSRQLTRMQRDLLEEKTKVKALSEELENPMNIHRWRKLEGSDPASYEMIQKIQTSQRKLIKKTEELVERELMLQEKDKQFEETQKLLARQPGPELSMQLSVYQKSLRDKNRQMKAMAAETNMLQAQVNEYTFEIERLQRELQDMKRKFYEQRRREQMVRDMIEQHHSSSSSSSSSSDQAAAYRQHQERRMESEDNPSQQQRRREQTQTDFGSDGFIVSA